MAKPRLRVSRLLNVVSRRNCYLRGDIVVFLRTHHARANICTLDTNPDVMRDFSRDSKRVTQRDSEQPGATKGAIDMSNHDRRFRIFRCCPAAAAIVPAALFALALTGFSFALGITGASARPLPEPLWRIDNPYESVDWQTHGRYKANLHTHTTHSDGLMNPHDVVDAYHRLGYDILAITDHDVVTYPWERFSSLSPSSLARTRFVNISHLMPSTLRFENRDRHALGMVAIEGNELSRHHHVGSYFNSHRGMTSAADSLAALAREGGIAMLFHPGRYTPPIPWYVNLYERNEHLFGLEVYNQGDRYPGDRVIWDAILSQTMPDRPVWGYSNDDSHAASHIGRNWSTFILPELSAESVRRGMLGGVSFFTYAPNGHSGAPVPTVESLSVDRVDGTITITASDYEAIEWIASGEVVGTERTIDLENLGEHHSYVRAKLFGSAGALTGTQPFGVKRLQIVDYR